MPLPSVTDDVAVDIRHATHAASLAIPSASLSASKQPPSRIRMHIGLPLRWHHVALDTVAFEAAHDFLLSASRPRDDVIPRWLQMEIVQVHGAIAVRTAFTVEYLATHDGARYRIRTDVCGTKARRLNRWTKRVWSALLVPAGRNRTPDLSFTRTLLYH